jgi:hypothetical protein
VERDELGLPDAALATFEAVWALDEAGPLADDAVWERAELYRAREDWDSALVELGRLAEPAESSWFVGSYDVEYADQARYDRGVILLERKGDWRAARAEFERFLSDYKDSLLSDDAAWGVVRAGRGGRQHLPGFRRAMSEVVALQVGAHAQAGEQQLVRAAGAGAAEGLHGDRRGGRFRCCHVHRGGKHPTRRGRQRRGVRGGDQRRRLRRRPPVARGGGGGRGGVCPRPPFRHALLPARLCVCGRRGGQAVTRCGGTWTGRCGGRRGQLG